MKTSSSSLPALVGVSWLLAAGLSAQPASRLDDFNALATDSSSLPGLPLAGDQFAFAGGLGYFVADDGVAGSELWVTDGTPGGTRMMRELRPGYAAPGTGGIHRSMNSPRSVTVSCSPQ